MHLHQQVILLIVPSEITTNYLKHIAVVTLGEKVPDKQARLCIHIIQCLHDLDFPYARKPFFFYIASFSSFLWWVFCLFVPLLIISISKQDFCNRNVSLQKKTSDTSASLIISVSPSGRTRMKEA